MENLTKVHLHEDEKKGEFHNDREFKYNNKRVFNKEDLYSSSLFLFFYTPLELISGHGFH